MSRNYGRGNVMVWAAFGYPVMWFSTVEEYQELLEFALDEYGDEINGPHFILIILHRAKSVKTWFEKPDLYPGLQGVQILSQ